jgi:hypothetical protein
MYMVVVLVGAHVAAGVERTRVPVTIQKFADFPDDLDVVFPDGSRRADVDVTWVHLTTGGTDKEKPSGHGGE